MRHRLSMFLLLVLFSANGASARSQQACSWIERSFDRIKEPVLQAYTQYAAARDGEAAGAFAGRYMPPVPAPEPDIPTIRKYANSHIAPTRMYVGGGLMAVGGVMLFAGYRQDTKYPWSGPYMSLSPLNVFGILIAAVGLCFMISGLIFYSKYKKYVIAPYNKSY